MLCKHITIVTSVLTCSVAMNNPFLRLNTSIDQGDPAMISSRGPAGGLVGVSTWGRDMQYIISTI